MPEDQSKSKRNKVLILLSLMLLSIPVFYLLGQFIQKNRQIDDSGALYGGQLEKGYLSAGYLISYEPTGSIKTCGYSVINNRIGITASHCVDNSQNIFIGKGDFSRVESRNIKVEKAIQRDGWVESKQRTSDFAVLVFPNTPGYYQTFAQVGTVEEGCNYRVVAYGRTENPEESGILPRKSAFVCASEVNPATFILTGKDSGICFGDSGSPVYQNNTERVVGVVASIVLENPDDSNPCAIGNKAIVVRTDANTKVVNDVIAEIGDTSVTAVNASDNLVVEVVKDNILEKVGVTYILSQTLDVSLNMREWTTEDKILVGTVLGALVCVLLLLALFLSSILGSEEKKVEADPFA